VNSRREVVLVARKVMTLPNGLRLEPRDYGATLHIINGAKRYFLRPRETTDSADNEGIDVSELVRAGHFLEVDPTV
jgi:hypothetical protein